MGRIDVRFLDAGRDPQCDPDPAYPDGRRVSLAEHALQKTCTRNLPYPAPRCGAYSIKCRVCGFVGVVTVAGRPDDPRVVTIPCKAN
jgi:hypothetical protein